MAGPSAVDFVREWLERSCCALAQARFDLLDLDRAIGDGDHGENLDRGFTAVRKILRRTSPAPAPDADSTWEVALSERTRATPEAPAVASELSSAIELGSGPAGEENASELLEQAAMTLLSTVGGAAGPLYGAAFLGAGRVIRTPLDGPAVAELLAAALAEIKRRGGADRGEKTMVDVWGPAADAAQEVAASGANMVEVWHAATVAATAGAEATTGMQATKGRASYLGERSVGYKDPGAESSRLIIEAAAAAARYQLAVIGQSAGVIVSPQQPPSELDEKPAFDVGPTQFPDT